VELLLLGLALGLAAGISPGPLLTLVVSSSLERGFGAGLRVALAPPLTDAPIIVLAIVLLKDLQEPFLAALGLLGGCLVIYLGLRTLQSRAAIGGAPAEDRGDYRDLWRGALVNFLNPHPWLSWVTVMGPILVQAWRASPLSAMAFVIGFYLAIVGSKVAIAWVVAQTRQRLSQVGLRRLLQTSGMLLLGLGLLLVWRALGTPNRASAGGGNQLPVRKVLEDSVRRQTMSELVRMWIGEGDHRQSSGVHTAVDCQQVEHRELQSSRRYRNLRVQVGVGIRVVKSAIEDREDHQHQGNAPIPELDLYPAQRGAGPPPGLTLEQGVIVGDHRAPLPGVFQTGPHQLVQTAPPVEVGARTGGRAPPDDPTSDHQPPRLSSAHRFRIVEDEAPHHQIGL
jgi:threonine/homoserine/homoserine lactone efflux protein